MAVVYAALKILFAVYHKTRWLSIDQNKCSQTVHGDRHHRVGCRHGVFGRNGISYSPQLDKSNTFRYTQSMKTTIAETLVEWDDNKNRIQKHGISFETAALVFADEERIEYYDELHSQDEDRFIVLGCDKGILYVVYTMRHEAARLISARMATPTERRIYYGE